LSPARGSEAISLILLAAVAATFAMGRLADFIGPLRVSILCALIQVGSLLGFVFVESLSGVYTLSVVHGIPYIAIVQGYALILRHLYGPAIAGWRLGDRRLAGRRDLRRDAVLPHSLPGSAGLQPAERDAAGPALFRPATPILL